MEFESGGGLTLSGQLPEFWQIWSYDWGNLTFYKTSLYFIFVSSIVMINIYSAVTLLVCLVSTNRQYILNKYFIYEIFITIIIIINRSV